MKLPGKLDALKNNGENMYKTRQLFLAAIVCAMLAPTPALPAQGDAATAPAGGLTFEAFDALDPDKANALPKATLEELGRMLLAKGDRLRDGKNGKPDLGGAQELYFQAAATGYPVAYDRIGDGFLNEEIAENYMLQTMDDRKRVAAKWYAAAASQGLESARQKLARLGQNVPEKAAEPLPACPHWKYPGQTQITGTWLGESNHNDAFGYLVKTPDGKTVDIVMGNGDFMEFANVKKGDTITLSYSTELFLDEYEGRCARTHFYVESSGKIHK